MEKTLPTYFISHGGGPWPWLKKEMPFYDELESSLEKISKELTTRPQAVLMISGHWEEDEFTVMSAERPGMLYDYGGFPPRAYQVKYPSPGHPELAMKIQRLLKEKGFQPRLDSERAYDHGTFVPMQVMYPQADIPLLQLSIRSNYDPKEHLEAGQALAALRQEGVLIVGSGLSYHDLTNFPGERGAKEASKGFDDWLTETVSLENFKGREERLVNWSEAPFARQSHPREDHLIPLMVAAGAARNETAKVIYHEEDFMGNLTVSSYKFG